MVTLNSTKIYLFQRFHFISSIKLPKTTECITLKKCARFLLVSRQKFAKCEMYSLSSLD